MQTVHQPHCLLHQLMHDTSSTVGLECLQRQMHPWQSLLSPLCAYRQRHARLDRGARVAVQCYAQWEAAALVSELCRNRELQQCSIGLLGSTKHFLTLTAACSIIVTSHSNCICSSVLLTTKLTCTPGAASPPARSITTCPITRALT